MYGIKDDLDFSFLIGKEILQVAVGAYQIIFNCDGNVSISVESGLSYDNQDTIVNWKPGDVDIATRTVMLVSQRISAVKVQDEGLFQIDFENGDKLLLEENPDYESFQISYPDGIIIV